ncbi:MAG: hypothetical protein AB7G75_22680 [Candidatus Binatia bacterium]
MRAIKDDDFLPYIKQGPIYYIPVIPQRLSSAILVRKALARLDADPDRGRFDERDVIAVALPDSVRWHIISALAKLPHVSLVVVGADANDDESVATTGLEVFPVTPCDGMIEAIRIATQEDRKIPLWFIDREIAPGNLLDRQCLPLLDWADDWYPLVRGAAKFLHLIRYRLTHQPWRSEPVDTWREKFMAYKLRLLAGQYRRILFVCPAPNVEPIRQLLNRNEVSFETNEEFNPNVVSMSLERRPDIALRNLDDFPRLVAEYEENRTRDGDWLETFDKNVALLDCIGRFDQEKRTLTIKHYDAFVKMLAAVLEERQRISPDPKTFYDIARMCFGQRFVSNLRSDLLSYGTQITEEQKKRVGGDLTAIYEKSSNNGHYVGRTCNPLFRDYHLISADTSWAQDWHTWPAYREHDMKMRQRVLKIVTEDEIIQRSEKLQGYLGRGIDARKTLQSYFQGDRSIYIKTQRLKKNRIVADEFEPIVWIFDSRDGLNVKICDQIYFRPKSSYYIWCAFSDMSPIFLHNEEKSKAIELKRLTGVVSFAAGRTVEEQMRSRLGDQEFTQRFPQQDSLEIVTESSRKWWEQLILSAIHYAKHTAFCVLPGQLSTTSSLAEEARQKGKTLCTIPSSRFCEDDLTTLSLFFHVEVSGLEEAHGENARYDDNIVNDYYKDFMNEVMLNISRWRDRSSLNT